MSFIGRTDHDEFRIAFGWRRQCPGSLRRTADGKGTPRTGSDFHRFDRARVGRQGRHPAIRAGRRGQAGIPAVGRHPLQYRQLLRDPRCAARARAAHEHQLPLWPVAGVLGPARAGLGGVRPRHRLRHHLAPHWRHHRRRRHPQARRRADRIDRHGPVAGTEVRRDRHPELRRAGRRPGRRPRARDAAGPVSPPLFFAPFAVLGRGPDRLAPGRRADRRHGARHRQRPLQQPAGVAQGLDRWPRAGRAQGQRRGARRGRGAGRRGGGGCLRRQHRHRQSRAAPGSAVHA